MEKKAAFKKLRKIFLLTVIFFTQVLYSFPEDWTLAASKFTFTDSEAKNSSQKASASLIPQLVLEQIAENSSRLTTREEMLDRSLNTLLTERLSLFLQLSKEVKTRDSLFLTETNQKKLGKKILESEEKIAEIQEKISENLDKASRLQKEYDERLPDKPAEKIKEKKFSFLPFSNSKKEERLLPEMKNEPIVLYKKDSSQLFEGKNSYGTYEFEKSVTDQKINGLITGEIKVLGDYAFVTASLYIFPGGKAAGTATEVGLLSDCVGIARNIARTLMPQIVNSKPVTLYISIQPEQALSSTQMAVDGVVFQSVPEKFVVDSGVHTLEFFSREYIPKTLTYNFINAAAFEVEVPLEKKESQILKVNMYNPVSGNIYADGSFAGTVENGIIGADVVVNGKPVIGQFIAEEHYVKKVTKIITDEDGNKKVVVEEEDKGPLSFFYYIPENLLTEGASLIVKGQIENNASEIDKRRRWMYAGYTAVVVSLPFMLYATGHYNALVNSYNSRGYDDIDNINKWNTIKNISTGVTIGCACFMGFELVRYLRTANKVLPYEAKKAELKELELARSKSQNIVPINIIENNDTEENPSLTDE